MTMLVVHGVFVVPAIFMLLVGSTGCAIRHVPVTSALKTSPPSSMPPQVHGSSYQIQRGESLWRVAYDFGWDANALARANRLSNPAQVAAGQYIFIPPPVPSTRFLWPARGKLVPVRGADRQSVRGLQIAAQGGSLVRASRSGRVAVATRELVGWGQTVVLDHGDGYTSIYAGLEQILVSPGMSVQQGNPVGKTGGDPLHFEIRRGITPLNPLPLLP